jgi:hypothetical protein
VASAMTMYRQARVRERSMDKGKLWSFLRSTLSQGGDIWIDHQTKGYEQYSIRLDAAARERADAFEALVNVNEGEPHE